MLIFTHSCILSVVVVVSTVMVIIVLSFFITVVMGWEVGLIEVIAFIYFIGRWMAVSPGSVFLRMLFMSFMSFHNWCI